MIRTQHECQVEYREHMRDGEGTVQITNFITGPAELNEKGRLFAKITLNPGCSIGYHIHEKDAELFYIMKGTAEYNDNNVIRIVKAGDVTICPTGQGHGIAKITLNPGCSIGYHIHEKDAELFYIMKGTAEYNDNNVIRIVKAGDVTICPTGQGHGIANKTDEVVELVAVIVYA